jgi:hypothetical protein
MVKIILLLDQIELELVEQNMVEASIMVFLMKTILI